MSITIDDMATFKSSLNLPKVADKILKTSEDCHSFYIGFYGRNRYVADDLLDYREKKIKEDNITVDIFLEMCYTNEVALKTVFENVFYTSFTECDMEVIQKALDKNKTSLEKIFTSFSKNPNKNILQLVI